MEADFLGSGWTFPVRVDKDHAMVSSQGEESIKESIQIILGTAKGERQMRSDFGCGIHELVFALNNTATAGMAAYHVEQALIRWEPRIELLKVNAFPDRETKGGASAPSARLIITVEYRVIATNSIFNLVYPFYLTEGAGA